MNLKCFKLSLALSMALGVFGCGVISRDEVSRVSSPDGRIEAVLFEKNGGATTSFSYDVAVSDANHKAEKTVAWLYGALRNRSAFGASLRWNGNNELVVEFYESREKHLIEPTLQIAGRTLSVVLRNGVVDSGAPPGGMYFNVQKSRGSK